MLRKIVLTGAAAAVVAFAGLGAVSQPAEAGVSVRIGVPGVYGYYGPRYYAPPAAYYYAPAPRYYQRPRCKDVVVWKKVWTQRYGWVKKKVVKPRCW